MKKDPTLQSMLTHLAQNAAQPNEIDLWPAIQVRLTANNCFSPAKETPMKANITYLSRKRIVVIGAFTLLITIGLMLALPLGRAWAESLLRYFSFGEETQVVPTVQPITMIDVSPKIAQSTLTLAPTPTYLPAFFPMCGDPQLPKCTLSQVRELVDFVVKAPGIMPKGIVFEGASGSPDNVVLKYTGPSDLLLFINQGPRNEMDIQQWKVPESAEVATVQIGGWKGEYVQGGWSHYAGDRTANWDPDLNLQTLRWQEEDILYTISVVGAGDHSIVDQASLVSMAESMLESVDPGQMVAVPQTERTRISLSDVEKQAGFQAIEPGWLPDGYQFRGAWYVPEYETICIEYHHTADNNIRPNYASLTIAESVPGISIDLLDLFPDRPQLGRFMEVDKIAVGGAKGGYGLRAHGAPDPAVLCGETTFQDQVLRVITESMIFTIFSHSNPWQGYHNFLTLQKQVRLAESLTGIDTIPSDQIDPEMIPSVELAEQLAGFHIKLPTRLPEGVSFNYARYTRKLQAITLEVLYNGGQGSPQGGNVFSVSCTVDPSQTLKQIYSQHPEIYEKVQVNRMDALITQGFWDANGFVRLENGGDGGMSLTWFENGMQYTISGFNLYPKDIWIKIAESME